VPAKRYSVEQIVARLRKAEKHQGQGLTIPQSCKRPPLLQRPRNRGLCIFSSEIRPTAGGLNVS
jgi:hypothetical protein